MRLTDEQMQCPECGGEWRWGRNNFRDNPDGTMVIINGRAICDSKEFRCAAGHHWKIEADFKATQDAERIAALTAQKDGAYAERNQVVIAFARAAMAYGCRVGMAKHDPADTSWEDDWRNLIVIELPTGQITWHFHDSEAHLWEGIPTLDYVWDGHDTPEKYRRLNNWRPISG